MDLPLLPFLSIFIIILTLIIARARKRAANLPPSPWKLPFLGNLHQLRSAAAPPRTFRELAGRCGPIMHLKLGQVDHIVISSPEAAREILKTLDLNFASRPQLIAPTVMFRSRSLASAPYGSYWRHVRKISMLELLSARRVKSYRAIREQETSSLVASIKSFSAGESPVNLSEKFLLLTNTVTARAAFGTTTRHASRFILEAKKVIEIASGFKLLDLFPSLWFLDRLIGTTAELERIRGQLDEVLEDIMREHNTAREGKEVEDFLDVPLRIKEEGDLDLPLTTLDIKALILGMFIAGTETSASTLTWAMAELIRHPSAMVKAQRQVREAAEDNGRVEEADVVQMQYMKSVIKETLRLHMPLPLLLRTTCNEKCNLGGFDIPVGSRIIINAWAIARDPTYWEDGESFMPERFEESSSDFKGENFQYLPFGGERRMCPGIEFRLANVELALAQLLFHFDWELPEGKELDMTEIFGSAMAMKSDLCLIATPWTGA